MRKADNCDLLGGGGGKVVVTIRGEGGCHNLGVGQTSVLDIKFW